MKRYFARNLYTKLGYNVAVSKPSQQFILFKMHATVARIAKAISLPAINGLSARLEFQYLHRTFAFTSAQHISDKMEPKIQQKPEYRMQHTHLKSQSTQHRPNIKGTPLDRLMKLSGKSFNKELKSLMRENHEDIMKEAASFLKVICDTPNKLSSDVVKDAATILILHLSQHDLPTMIEIRKSKSSNSEIEAILDEQFIKLLHNIEHPVDLIHALQYWSCSDITSPEALLLLESKTLKMADRLNAKAISIVMHQLSLRTFRNTSLLKTLVDKLYRKPSNLSIKQLGDLLYACATLKLYSPKMLTFLGAVFNNSDISMTRASKSALTNMLLSIGKLRWHHVEALNKLCDAIDMTREPHLALGQFTEMCVTFGIVGHLPESLHPHLATYIEKASKDNVQYYLDIVWSLQCLGIHTEDILLDILTHERITTLVSGKSHIHQYNGIKLLNLVTEMKISYDKSVARDTLDGVKLLEPSTNDLLKELSSMWPVVLDTEPELILPRHFSRSGHLIDFLFLYNSKTKKVEDPSKYRKLEEQNSDKEPTSSDMKWVAVLVHQFQDKTTSIAPINKLIGRKLLTIRQLQALGYTLFQIDETEFKADPNRDRRRDTLKHTLYDQLAASYSADSI